jgi:hypothetical protein
MKHVCRLGLALAMVAMMMAPAAAADKAKTVQGKVTAVAGDSLTIAKGADSMTFTVDNTTKIVGKGLTTKSNEKAAAGEKMTLTDSVGDGDMVTVTYHEMDGKMHAATVKITQKALSTTK